MGLQIRGTMNTLVSYSADRSRGRLKALMSPVVFALLLLNAACSDGDANSDSSVTTEAWTELEALRDTAIHGISDLELRGDEIWMLSPFEPFVHRVADDSLVHSFGHPGEGPGELGRPWNLLFSSGTPGAVVVWDAGRRRLVWFDRDGEFLRERPVELSVGQPIRGNMREITYAPVQKLEPFADGFIVQDHPTGVSHTGDLARSRLIRLDAEGAPLDTVFDFGGRLRSGSEEEQLSQGVAMVPAPLWTVCKGPVLVIFDPFSSTIHRIRSDGPVETDSVPLTERTLTEEEKRAYLRHMVVLELNEIPPGEEIQQMVTQAMERSGGQFARTAPPAAGILCGAADGELWLQVFDARDHPLGYGRTWRVIRSGSCWDTPARRRPSYMHVTEQSLAAIRSALDEIMDGHRDGRQVAGIGGGEWDDTTP